MPWGAANPSMVSGVALGPPPSQAHLLPYLHAGGPRASLSRESDFLDGRQMCCSSSCKAASCRRCLRAVTHGLPGGQSWGFAFLRCWQAGQAVLHASGVGNGAAELWAAHRAPRAAVCPPRPPLSAQHRVLLITQRMKSFSGTFLGLFWAALLALCCWPQRAQLTRGGGCGAARCFGCRLGSTGRSLWPQHSSGLCDTAKKCEKCKKKKKKILLSLLLQMNTGGGRTIPNYISVVWPRLEGLSESSTARSVRHPFLSTVTGTHFWVCAVAVLQWGAGCHVPRTAAPHPGVLQASMLLLLQPQPQEHRGLSVYGMPPSPPHLLELIGPNRALLALLCHR